MIGGGWWDCGYCVWFGGGCVGGVCWVVCLGRWVVDYVVVYVVDDVVGGDVGGVWFWRLFVCVGFLVG